MSKKKKPIKKALTDLEKLQFENARLQKQLEKTERQRKVQETKITKELEKQGYTVAHFGKTQEKVTRLENQIAEIEKSKNMTEYQKKILKERQRELANFDIYKHSALNYLGTQNRDIMIGVINEAEKLGVDTSNLDSLLFSNTAIYQDEFIQQIEKATKSIKEEVLYKHYQNDIDTRKAERLLNAINSVDWTTKAERLEKVEKKAEQQVEELKRKYGIT